MGKFFNKDGTKTDVWNYDIGVKQNKAELAELLAIAKKNKLEVPEEKPKISILDKVFGFLNAGETAPAVYEYLSSGDVGKAATAQGQASLKGLTGGGQTDKKTYEDVLVDKLGFKKGLGTKIGGIAGDILLDPTTYFGGAIAKSVLKTTGKVGAKTVKAVSKVPVLGPLAEGGAKVVQDVSELFSPLARVTKGGLKKETATKWLSKRDELIKAGRYEEASLYDEILNAGKKLEKGAGKEIGKAIEEGTNRKFLYHGTNSTAAKEIEKEGFKLGSYTDEWGNTKTLPVSLMDNPKGALLWAKQAARKRGGTPSVLKVDITGVDKSPSRWANMGKGMNEFVLYKDDLSKVKIGTNLGPEATKTKEFVQKSSKELRELELKEGFEVGERANYMAHVLTDEARDFTKRYGFDIPALQKGLGFSKSRTIEGSAESINKEFRSWLKGMGEKEFDLFEEDALKALASRGAGSIRARTAKALRDEAADNFGILDGAMQEKAGKFFNDKVNIIDGTKYVPTPGIKMGAGEDLVEIGAKGASWVPEGIARDMEEINKVFINDDSTKELFKIYDKALGWFKGSVTSIFPSFHMNNLKGGIFNNFIAGVTNPGVYFDVGKIINKSDEVVKFKNWSGTYKQLAEELGKRGAINAGGYMDIAAELDRAGKMGAQGGPIKRGTQKIMNKIETFNRGSLALDTLRKGGTMDEAVEKIFKYQFDYMPEAFTPFERNVMRRIIPFYTWSRNNIPLMLEASVKQPGKIGAVGKVARDVSNISPEERAQMPGYMKESFPIKVGDQTFYGANLPIEDLNRLNMKGFMSSMSPMIKAPLERYTGKNFFFDQPIEDFKRAPSWFKGMPKPIKDFFGYAPKTGAKGQDTSELDPYKYHLLTSVLGRYVFTADKLADPDTSKTIKTLYALLGVKGTNFDPKQMEYYNTKEDIEKLGEFLKKKGAVREFSRIYEPKK